MSELPKKKRKVAHTKEIISDIIKVMTKDQMEATLNELLENNDNLDRLNEVFSKYPIPWKEKNHCVRCHQDYDPNFQVPDECIMEHDLDSAYSDHDRGEFFRCPDCGIQWGDGSWDDMGEDGPHDHVCFSGFHTTDPDEVEYNERNFMTCEENGCDHCTPSPPPRTMTKPKIIVLD